MGRLKRFVFALLGKDPEAVVVSFWTGSDELVLKMIEEILYGQDVTLNEIPATGFVDETPLERLRHFMRKLDDERKSLKAGEFGKAMDQLKKLGELHTSGVITDAEFEQKKSKLMADL